ncbi:hypothetical protein CDAR_32401 [Caerostris darwini]|uniref:Uncharacterized protein n=1 Tax=Caerostris darwini TaxID=1538125 RepID=A0AAV4WMU6_9ARAC|nr:hypothetical protein CDAR_32401 [Caerostris darwini]
MTNVPIELAQRCRNSKTIQRSKKLSLSLLEVDRLRAKLCVVSAVAGHGSSPVLSYPSAAETAGRLCVDNDPSFFQSLTWQRRGSPSDVMRWVAEVGGGFYNCCLHLTSWLRSSKSCPLLSSVCLWSGAEMHVPEMKKRNKI